MKLLQPVLSVMLSVGVLGMGVGQVYAGIGASGNTNLPSTISLYNGAQGSGFEITEDVLLDPAAGPWLKRLVNDGPTVSSGTPFQITEVFTNVGNIPWTDWHEEIQTMTSIPGAIQTHGFLFRNDSLNLMADYGNGFVGLVEGTDYDLVTMPYEGPPIGDNMNHWHAIWIFFEPHAVIQTGDTLKIEKRIFEVFGDANPWPNGQHVEIAQYPTPEPTTLAMGLTLAAVGLLRRRVAD